MRLNVLFHFSKLVHAALETPTQLTNQQVQISKSLSCQTCLKTTGAYTNTDMNDLNSLYSALIFLFNSVGKMREQDQLPSVVLLILKMAQGTKLHSQMCEKYHF